MLFFSSVSPKALELLKKIKDLPVLKDFYLVGGTTLALKYGHRVSIDLDFFYFIRI
jgi:Nucleotidyl transferase AbiEii toxin, Type IV TA system